MKIKKITFFLFAFFGIGVGLYPLLFLVTNSHFPLLNSKSQELLASVVWNVCFYTHVGLGGVALMVGWSQFSKKFRKKYLGLHRVIGKIYVVSVLLSSVSGIYIGYFATGGVIPATGFISLGIIWFYTTLKAFTEVKAGRIEEHERMMIYSYAACFAAVNLRMMLPLLIMIFDDFIIAYQIVAWACWIPNLVIAHFIILNKKQSRLKFQ